MDLLMAQFSNGHLSIEDIVLILDSDYETMWESKLKSKFSVDDKGLYYNEKLDVVINERKAYKKGRLDNLKGKKKSHKGDHKENHKGIPHENPMCLNENKDKDKDKKESKKKAKHKYGEYQNVLLTDDEKNKLSSKFGKAGAIEKVRDMDEAIELKGYKYKSHYLAILKWNRKETDDDPNQDYPIL